jgi:hypothetical protein
MAENFILREKTPIMLDTNRNFFGLDVKGRILAQDKTGASKTVAGVTYDDAAAPEITLTEYMDTNISDFSTPPAVQSDKDITAQDADLYAVSVDNVYDLEPGDVIYFGSEAVGSRDWRKFNEVVDIVDHSGSFTIVLKYALRASLTAGDTVHRAQNTGYYEYTFDVNETNWAEGDKLTIIVEDLQGQTREVKSVEVRKSEADNAAVLQSRADRMQTRLDIVHAQTHVEIHI